MIIAFFFCTSLKFYAEPVVYRASFTTYRRQVEELQAAVSAKQRLADSLITAGKMAAAESLDQQINADEELLATHTQLQKLIAERGYFYLEFEIEIPYQELTYREENNLILADIRLVFKLASQERPDSLTDTLFYRYSIPSFAEAVRQEPTFTDQFGLFIPAGRYEYEITITSGNNTGAIRVPYEINAGDYEHASGLLVASRITADTTGGYFNKGGLKVYPRPCKIFNDLNPNLFAYLELYDLKARTIHISYEILNRTGRVLRRAPQLVQPQSDYQSVNFGFNTLGIAAGDYRFQATIADSAAGMFITRSTEVQIARKESRPVTFEGQPYYEEIEYFVSERKYREFQKMNPEGRALFLKKIWQELDYPIIARRFEDADSMFREGRLAGHKTDRGRIYVKFGPPDEVKRMTMEQKESRPFEHWVYYNGTHFVFVDIRSTHEYTLVWTNERQEKKQPSLYKFLPDNIYQAITNEENPTFLE